MKSLVILVVAICFAKLPYAIADNIGVTEPTCKLLEKSDSKDVNKITPRKYIAQRVIVELGKAGYTLTPQKVSI